MSEDNLEVSIKLLATLRPFAVAAERCLQFGQPLGGVQMLAVTRSRTEFELFAESCDVTRTRDSADDELLKVQHMLDAREAFLAAGGEL